MYLRNIFIYSMLLVFFLLGLSSDNVWASLGLHSEIKGCKSWGVQEKNSVLKETVSKCLFLYTCIITFLN